MPEQEAIVIELEDDMAIIERAQSSQCGGCNPQNSCQPREPVNRVQSVVLNPVGAVVGDRVLVTVDPMSLLLANLFVYVLPLVTLILGASVGYILTDPDSDSSLYPLLGAGFGLLISVVLIAHFKPHLKNEQRYAPRIAEILQPSDSR